MQAPVAVKIFYKYGPPPTQPSEGKSRRGGGIRKFTPTGKFKYFWPLPPIRSILQNSEFFRFLQNRSDMGGGAGGDQKFSFAITPPNLS